MTDEAAHRAARAVEVFDAALEQARAGRVTMSELCAQHNTNPKTVNNHIGRGWLRGQIEDVGGKPVWFFEPDEVRRYAQIRQEYGSEAAAKARCARGGNKLAQAPPGFVTLIDISARTGHSMDFMRAAALRFRFETVRGPKSVTMLHEADVPHFIETIEHIPPRPGRQKKRGGRMSIVWTEEMDAALGKEPDSTLAGRWGVSVAAVQQRRQRLGIARLRRRGPQVDWTAEMDSELGRSSDTALAGKWGLRPQTVRQRRQRLGIENHPLSGGDLDEFGIRRRGARRHVCWTKEMLAALGTETDLSLARKWGITVGVISIRRRALGIPSFTENQSRGKDMTAQLTPALRAKIEEAKPVLLKKLSDLGIDLPVVTDEQIIGFALDQVLKQTPLQRREE